MRERVLDRAIFIPGQTWRNELHWLYTAVVNSKVHVEVGAFCGRSLFVTAGAMRNATLYCVELPDPGGWGHQPMGGWAKKVLEVTFEAIKENSPTVKVEPMWCGSMMAAIELQKKNVQVDSIFIDGDHCYESIYADINSWFPLMKQGGIMIGHDYDTNNIGVMDAVNELLPNFQVWPNTRMWYAKV